MPSQVPLCVDLDGTLWRTDSLIESLLALVKSNPLTALRVPLWILSGRASFKHKLANNVELDVGSLPINLELLEYLVGQRHFGKMGKRRRFKKLSQKGVFCR